MGQVQVVGPNKALIISGASRSTKEARVIVGGRAFVPWIFQRADTLSLELRTITVTSKRSATAHGVMVAVAGCCQVKISGFKEFQDKNGKAQLTRDMNALLLASQHFIGASDADIEKSVSATLEGHQRSICGTLSVEELYRDRQAFSAKVRELAAEDLRLMGMELVSYTITTLSDEDGYLESLGVSKTAEVKKTAQIGESVNANEARQREAEEGLKATLKINTGLRQKEESNRDVELVQAQYRQEVGIANARAAAAAKREAAHLMQQIVEEEAKQDVVRATVDVDRKRMELEASIRTQADADLFRKRREAEGIREYAQAEADRIRVVGEAEAEILCKKQEVEIEMLRRKAEVMNSYENPALASKMMETLPEVAAALAAPLSQTDRIVFMGAGGGAGGGPSQFIGDLAKSTHVVNETLQAVTGVSLGEVLKGGQEAQGMDKWIAPVAINAMMAAKDGQ